MHCKPPKVKTMASLSGGGSGTVGGGSGGVGDDDADGDSTRTSVGHSPKSYSSNNNNNNNNNNDNNSNNINTDDPAQIKLKKQTLEQRKQELEKLLSEKSWILQQLQKQETQILNGNYEYLNLNEIFGQLQQYKQDASSAVLRRKTAAKENQLNNNNNNNNSNSNRQSEISNRSSEYDNYPGEQMATSQPPVSTAHKVAATKKRQTSQNWNSSNSIAPVPAAAVVAPAITLPATQNVQQPQTQQQLRQHYIAQMTEQQHFQYTQQQLLQHQQQHRQLLPHQHYHPRPQIVTAYQSPTLPQADAISMYSANSANVATLRQHPQHQQLQTPIVVQCDKYYLSPTHQSYSDGGFIKSSQNIKQYISPLSSPTILQQQQQQSQPLKPLQLQQQRNFDVISLSPSYAAIIDPPSSGGNEGQNMRWRSQTNIQQYNNAIPTSTLAQSAEKKTYSSDMLTQLYPNSPPPPHTLLTTNFYSQQSLPSPVATAAAAGGGGVIKSKPIDEISISSYSSETQKKQKPKQWLESSLDGPVIRSSANDSQSSTPTPILPSQAQLLQPPARPPSTTHHHKPHTGASHHMQRERPRLSSQSMCSAQRYNSIAAQRGKASRLLQDDDGKYAKLSQSTSYLNSLETISVTTYFPEPLPLSTAAAAAVTAPSPLPPRNLLQRAVPPIPTAVVAVDKPALSPEIRIESPKNMTIVQQATFQPYKEITKPFEMADFYKYSTKFRQKETPTPSMTNVEETLDKAEDDQVVPVQITSFIRPHGRYKLIEDKSKQQLELEQQHTTLAGEPTISESQHQQQQVPINNVEFIPTLQFISQQPRIVEEYAASATCISNNSSINDDDNADEENDNASGHTFVIAYTAAKKSTDCDDSIEEQALKFSLTSTDKSFIDEPTSSISIEMDTFNKTTTSSISQMATATTTTTTGASATETAPSENSDHSIMITKTPTTTQSSGEHSIEEEIEEAIEIAEEDDQDDISGVLSHAYAAGGSDISALSGAELSDAAATGMAAKQRQLFDLDESLTDDHDIAKINHSSEFEIDDEQLSGGKLAQHFVLNDDDDNDDNEVDFNIDLPMEKGLLHSRHDDTITDDNNPLSAEIQKDSLTNQSTAGDVSDLVEEDDDVDVDFDEGVTSLSDALDLPLPDEALKATAASLEDASNKVTYESKKLLVDAKLESEIADASSKHSEKDYLVEEIIVETNQKIEILSAEKSIEEGNVTQSTAIAATLQMVPLTASMTDHKTVKVLETLELKPMVVTTSEKNEQHLEESSSKPIESVASLQLTPVEAFKEKLTSAVDVIEKRTVRMQETLQLSPISTEPIQETQEIISEEQEKSIKHSLLTALQSFKKQPEANQAGNSPEPNEDDEDNSMELMKLRIFAIKEQQQQQISNDTSNSGDLLAAEQAAAAVAAANLVKQMERVPLTEFSKDVLEDITEESERNSLSTADEQQTLSLEKSETVVVQDTSAQIKRAVLLQPIAVDTDNSSVVSLNMIHMLEQKVNELQSVLASKDACLASLNLQLETAQRRESSNGGSYEQPVSSGRDLSSLVTNSTEYRTFQEEYGAPTMDFLFELTKRDELIAKLTDSLQQSLNVRENLQTESEKLNIEIQLLRKQLTEAMDSLRRPLWQRGDQESNGGQRISEISMDLISESDDDLERQFLTDNEEKVSRNSRERQLSLPRQMDEYYQESNDYIQAAFSKQMEQFQKYLTPNEVRLFFMVQKKFDDYLGQELEKCKMKQEQELKTLLEKLESEKQEKNNEINRLLQQRKEKEHVHSKEMEDLRKYFEHKCADLEKQFSDEVFSQKSQHLNDTSSEGSDQENMPEEYVIRSKETSPRKRSRAELLLSPSHRQMTPSGDGLFGDGKNDASNLPAEILELKAFYQQKIRDLQRVYDDNNKKLHDKIKYYENRYPEDDFMTTSKISNNDASDTSHQSVTTQVRDPNTSFIIIDQDELNSNNESQVIQKIIEEYEKRLQEQLTLAREDMVHELENQIQTLLSETTSDDHWPPEFILLREKFTAKSQLEIAQLQIKHEEEMSRLKLDVEKQLNRKNKRHSNFDLARDFEQIKAERDSLRELTKAFRHVLVELAKCVVNCEDEINESVCVEVQRLLATRTMDQSDMLDINLNLSTSSNTSMLPGKRYVPDVTSLLEIIEDPSLKDFISNKSCAANAAGNCSFDYDDFNLKECMERLRSEAVYLYQLSEEVKHKHIQKRTSESSGGGEKNDSCCEAEDGLKTLQQHPVHKFMRANSLNEQQLSNNVAQFAKPQPLLNSLPPDLNRLQQVPYVEDDNYSSPGNASELNFQLHELKNRLLKSESDRQKLQQKLEHTIRRNAELGDELQNLRDQFTPLDSLNRTDYAEGYGLGPLKSPENLSADRLSANFSQLQERARNLLSTPTHAQQQENNNDVTVVLLQMIEDFCREGDKVVECSRRDREDLQKQIDAADKQRKNTQQFLEEQAAEREQERIEFTREIERLQLQLREKEKERNTFENASKEVEQLESQIRELNQKLKDSDANREKFEVELKASIDKIFVLREIIVELEKQVETKALNEHVLEEKIKQLDEFINSQSHSNDRLQQEVHSLKTEININYQERIRQLEEKLQNVRPSAEQSMVLEQVIEQLQDIENALDHKTKALESLHNSISSNSCSLSATEDVSVHGTKATNPLQVTSFPATTGTLVTPPQGSPLHPSPRQHSLSMEGVQRIMDKLSKHTRVEEAAIKRIKDLEMQIASMRSSCVELQHERDSLQERMSEQKERISGLQQRLEEQRQRAEELQRAGTSDLNIRIHDLQNELQNLKETLGSRDKQIFNMRQQLEKSKAATDRLEAELSVAQQPDRSIIERLERDLKQRDAELKKMKDKIKSEMINKLALPDLMETMLEDKNEEIDHLKEQLETKEKELQSALEANSSRNCSADVDGKSDAKEEASTKLSARTLSDILSITEFDEPDVIRRAVVTNLDTPLVLPEGANHMQQTMETSKEAIANLTHKRTDELSAFTHLHPTNTFDNPHYFQDANFHITGKTGSTITPTLMPRQINFSAFTEDSKLKPSTPTSFSFDIPAQGLRNASLQKSNDEYCAEIDKLQNELKDAKENLLRVEKEKQEAVAAKELELKELEENSLATQQRLGELQAELLNKQQEVHSLQGENLKLRQLQDEIASKCNEIEELLKQIALLKTESKVQSETLSKHEKDLVNYRENESGYLQRISELEAKILALEDNSNAELVSLRNDFKGLSEVHEQCKSTLEAHMRCKQQLDALNQEIKTKDERLLMLNTKLSIAEDTAHQLQQQTACMEQEIEKLRSQQQSDNSSKQFSVDEIAQQVEKELNYSAQLDSNILKAIESEEENNLDCKNAQKDQPAARAASTVAVEQQTSTDDENFIGERDLLNQLEALRAQVQVEREYATEVRKELLQEKLHSQDIQEQDVVIIEAMRKRLETALAQEDELHKMLDQEREKCERLQSQLTVLQRSESRRNSALMKSPTESPRKSPRNSDFESELAERLRSEIKLLTSQNERERERNVDLQRNLERERVRFDTELKDRIEYSDKLNKEMEKLARDKEIAEQEVEHLQERLVLQAQEIESLEARIAALQEVETRRISWRERQQRESTQNAAEIQELKTKLSTLTAERDSLQQVVTRLRFDVERSATREAKLAEALANANANAVAYEAEASIPQQFLQKMKDINVLLAENAKENRQMAETVQFLVEERRQLQKKCEELESQLGSNVNVNELEERCHHLLGRYLRVESHRKALVYQKRYLKVSLEGYQESEARALAAINGGHLWQPPKEKKRLFKTVAIAIIAIQRMKFIVRIWRTGKRIVSKSVFTITQQKNPQLTIPPKMIWNPAKGLNAPTLNDNLMPLQTPALLNECECTIAAAATSTTPNEPTQTWSRLLTRQLE